MSKRVCEDVPVQCGWGGCRAPEAPNPLSCPARGLPLSWEKTFERGMIRKSTVPVYHYAS